METGAAIAIAAGALVFVFLITRQKEAQTAAVIAAAKAQQYQPGGAISLTDAFNVFGVVASTYVGGASAGANFAKGIH